ncbi:hypothetical protein PR048_020035 [Dryococelus australis]|uniref:DUF4371 domain-containing protein n=1 Tax=Dryococelus australis TaxID=614101 RepID=A0ABQ9H567_9NEOP|nr:hypothetical protein PR048_020035 [Dryococelus australis]
MTLEKPEKKDGKFRAFLRYRAHTDEYLKHLIHCSRNATYVSPEIQNEIIGICGKLIEKKIVTEIIKAKCFAILGDEILDVSGQEQFPLCIRYVSNGDHPVLREDFVVFFPSKRFMWRIHIWKNLKSYVETWDLKLQGL